MPFYKDLRKEENKDYSESTIEGITRLRRQLKEEIPERTLDRTLLIATWNIRDFGEPRWLKGKKRLDESIYYIAEIISAFDIVAIQEIKRDLGSLRRLMRILGPKWDWICSDVTEGAKGNRERLGFIYDKRKIVFRNISGQIVLPEEGIRDPEAPKQIARTPFLASFQAGWLNFTLCNVHLKYDIRIKHQTRLDELRQISSILQKRKQTYLKDENYIILGDFNFRGPDDDGHEVLKENGFVIVDQTILPTNISQDKYYDQIAFIQESDQFEFAKNQNSGGVFNYFKSVFRYDRHDQGGISDEEIYKNHLGQEKGKKRNSYKFWRTAQMSDHYPLWIEMKIDFSDKYLEDALKKVKPAN